MLSPVCSACSAAANTAGSSGAASEPRHWPAGPRARLRCQGAAPSQPVEGEGRELNFVYRFMNGELRFNTNFSPI